MASRVAVGATVLALTLFGYFFFPGHTFLQSDAQIYIPILEHLWDPGVLRGDLIAERPHVAFTVYDEAALLLRWLSGASFEAVLTAQQLVYRALAILGIYLIAAALGLSTRMALLTAAAVSLGATIVGPAVLTFEYEPVPRGFAVALTFFALGLAAQGRDLGAGIAASLAFLYHPPTVVPFWAVYFAMTLWPTKPVLMSRHIRGLLPLLAAVLVLFALSRLQRGIVEPQLLFGQIPPWLEELQRMRASYNWVSVWARRWAPHYLLLWLISLIAYLRLRKAASVDLRFFLAGLPLVGLLSMPASYLLLERMKWVVVPQFQPTRALLFITAVAAIASAAAAVRAVQQRRWWEGALWFVVVYAIPTHTRISELLLVQMGNSAVRRGLPVVLVLAALALLAAWADRRGARWAPAPWAAALLAPFLFIPSLAGVRNYPALHTTELRQLTEWARVSTPPDAVVLFPDAGQDLYPGIFRARALRPVYVDWKSGGQLNYLGEFAKLWWSRWQATMARPFDPLRLDDFARRGIDYVVLRPAQRLAGRQPVFANSQFFVYRLEPHAGAALQE